jgi:hypothetical protein
LVSSGSVQRTLAFYGEFVDDLANTVNVGGQLRCQRFVLITGDLALQGDDAVDLVTVALSGEAAVQAGLRKDRTNYQQRACQQRTDKGRDLREARESGAFSVGRKTCELRRRLALPVRFCKRHV